MARAATKQRRPARGRFITFEGGEGSGKSTQIRNLAERLDAAHVATLVTREPGGTPGAEALRHVVLSGMGKLIGAELESLLFAAARDDHVHRVIAPALEAGTWVLCDRFADSTRVYQGILGEVDPHLLDALERVTIGDLKPDLTLVLDLPADVGLSRAAVRRGSGAADRFEAEGAPFHERLRQAYLQIARDNPERCVVIDATGTPDEVANRIWTAVRERLAPPPDRAAKANTRRRTTTRPKARAGA